MLTPGLKKIKTFKDGFTYHALEKEKDLLFTICGKPTKDKYKILKFIPCLSIFDISRPKKPKKLFTIQLSPQSYENHIPSYPMICIGQFIYVIDTSRIRIFDVSAPTDVRECEPFEYEEHYRSMQRWKGYLLVICDNKLLLFDTSNPKKPKFAAEIDMKKIQDIVFDGNYAYVTQNKGLSIYDFSDRLHPVHLGTYDNISNYIGDIALYQNYAIIDYGIEEYDETFYILINIGDKKNPQPIPRKMPRPQLSSTRLIVEDHYAYLGGYSFGFFFFPLTYKVGLYLIDLRDTEAQKYRHYWKSPNKLFDGHRDRVRDIVIENRTIYVTHERSGFSIIKNTMD